MYVGGDERGSHNSSSSERTSTQGRFAKTPSSMSIPERKQRNVLKNAFRLALRCGSAPYSVWRAAIGSRILAAWLRVASSESALAAPPDDTLQLFPGRNRAETDLRHSYIYDLST